MFRLQDDIFGLVKRLQRLSPLSDAGTGNGPLSDDGTNVTTIAWDCSQALRLGSSHCPTLASRECDLLRLYADIGLQRQPMAERGYNLGVLGASK